MTATDSQLLADFATRRDEAAFRELARRHLGLVFHTALRCTGNRTLAEDISQNVLCAVAEKAASLARHPERFAPWLHRATLFESSKAMRREASRHRRDRLQHPDSFPTTAADEPDSRWQATLPLLDAALDSLPEADRRVVLLHFFERHQFAHIAALVGKTPAAVQKQSVRALEKLARLLRTKGVAIPVGVLAAGLGMESAKAAPAALLATVTTAGMAAKATTGSAYLSSLMTSHPKLSLSCALLVCALPLGFQQWALAEAENELAALKGATSLSTPSSVARVRPENAPRPADELDLVKLSSEAGQGIRFDIARIQLKRKLEALDPATLSDLLGRLRTISSSRLNRDELARLMSNALARKDLAVAMDAVANGWIQSRERATNMPWGLIIYRNWLNTDLAAARTWLDALQHRPPYAEEAGKALKNISLLGGSPGVILVEDNLSDYRAELARALMSAGPDTILSYLRSFPDNTFQYKIVDDCISRGDRGPITPLEGEAWLAAINELPESGRQRLIAELTRLRTLRLPAANPMDGLTGLVTNPLTTPTTIILAGSEYLKNPAFSGYPDRKANVRQWLYDSFPGQAEALFDQTLQKLDQDQADLADRELNSLSRRDVPVPVESISYVLSTKTFKGDLKRRALKLAEDRIEDPQTLKMVREQIEKNSQR